MSKLEDISSAVTDLTEKFPETTKNADSVFATIIGFFDATLTPLKMLKDIINAKYQTFKDNLSAKYNKIPAENRKEEIDLKVIGPAVESLKFYIVDDELRDMFENLIVSSLDNRKNVFPGFVEIIRQLNSDEAKIIKRYSKDYQKSYPIIDIRGKLPSNKGFINLVSNFTNCYTEVCEKPEMIPLYIDDMLRLGLINIQETLFLKDENMYENIKKNSLIAAFFEKPTYNGFPIEMKKKMFEVTNLGKRFIDACVLREK